MIPKYVKDYTRHKISVTDFQLALIREMVESAISHH